MLTEAARPVMSPAAGFHPDQHGGQLGNKGHQSMAGQALAKDNLSRVVHSHHVKNALGDVDPKYAHLLLHWTRLLWLNGFIDLELILAHRSRSAQGRVHVITTVKCLLVFIPYME
jgi:hypothetical protein